MSSNEINQAQILVIEDESEIRELISLILLRQNYQVRQCETAMDAIKLIQANHHFDLIIVDWMLPGLTGIEFIENIRQTQKLKTPILMVTAKTEPQDIIKGLEVGADDYVSKPFEVSVFTARVKALLRRLGADTLQNQKTQSDILTLGPLELNIGTHEAKCNNETLHLTPSEFKIVHEMINSHGRVLTRDYLVKSVQGDGISVTERTIDTHIFGLRKKLGSFSDSIETIRGVGYRIKP